MLKRKTKNNKIKRKASKEKQPKEAKYEGFKIIYALSHTFGFFFLFSLSIIRHQLNWTLVYPKND